MTRTSTRIKQEISEQQAKLNFMRLPDILPLQAEVSRLTTKTTIEPTGANRSDLLLASQALEQAVAAQAEASRIGLQIRTLQAELQNAEQDERMAAIALVEAGHQRAIEEYLNAGKQLVRAYRRMLQTQRKCQQTPGAKSAIASGFDFVPINPSGWVGSTSEMMKAGTLPWEKRENEEAA